jgi:hypothetical protein
MKIFSFVPTTSPKMFKIVFILSSILAVAFAKVRSCDRGVLGPNPYAIRITGCDPNGEVCRIIRGKDITGSMDFFATKDTDSLEPEVTAYAFGVRAVYELPADRQNGCSWINGTFCPLDRGEFATYNLKMPVVEEYPLTKLDIEVRLYAKDRTIQFCTLIESEVVVA